MGQLPVIPPWFCFLFWSSKAPPPELFSCYYPFSVLFAVPWEELQALAGLGLILHSRILTLTFWLFSCSKDFVTSSIESVLWTTRQCSVFLTGPRVIHRRLIFITFKVNTTFQMTFECQGAQVFTYVSEARERDRKRNWFSSRNWLVWLWALADLKSIG